MEIIKSISYFQDEIISNILKLYSPNGKIDLDPTYSKGIFYKNIEKPKYKFDLFPQTKDTIKADCKNLPVKNNSIGCMILDLPFLISSGPSLKIKKCGSNIISSRFSCFKTVNDLRKTYELSIKESYRILNKKGILILKCQDTVSGGKNYFIHNEIYNMTLNAGFYVKDLFILLAKSRILGNIKKQVHARKFHSYFIVMEK